MSSPNAGRSGSAVGAVAFALLFLGLAASLIWGFTLGRGEATAEAEKEAAIRPDLKVRRRPGESPVVSLSTALQRKNGIETARPETREYRPDRRAYGLVLDLRSFTDLGAAIANAKAGLASAEVKLEVSKAAFDRAQMLYKNGQNISAAQRLNAEASYQTDQVAEKAAQVQMQNTMASAVQAWGQVLGSSLADGRSPATDLVEHRKVLIQVTLPVGVSFRRPPQTGSLESATGQQVAIALVSPASRTDPQIQGVSFLYTADAASPALPGMTVAARLPDGEARPALIAPASAVVWLQGRAWVYVETTQGAFVRREISTAQPLADGGYVLPENAPATGGLPPITTTSLLVVKGAEALLSQEFSAEIELGD